MVSFPRWFLMNSSETSTGFCLCISSTISATRETKFFILFRFRICIMAWVNPFRLLSGPLSFLNTAWNVLWQHYQITFIYRDEWEPQDLFLIPSKGNNLAFFEWSTCGSKVDALSNDGHVWLLEVIFGNIPSLISHQHLLCSRFTHGADRVGSPTVEQMHVDNISLHLHEIYMFNNIRLDSPTSKAVNSCGCKIVKAQQSHHICCDDF